MATIGNITVVFGADVRGLSDGVDESVARLSQLSDSVSSLSDRLGSISNASISISASVDSSALDELQNRIENSEYQIGVSADVEDLTNEIEEEVENTVTDLSETATVTIGADVRRVATAAAEVAREIEPLRRGFVIPITASSQAIASLRETAGSIRTSFAAAASAAGGFSAAVRGAANQNGTLGSSVILAASLYRAWEATSDAFENSSGAARTLSASLRQIVRSGGDQREVARAAVEGGSAFAGAAAGATAQVAAMRAVNAATERLNPRLRDSTRLLAQLGMTYVSAGISQRVAAASATVLATAVQSQANPLAAVSAFMQTYRRGVDAMSISATAATDRQRVFVRAMDLIKTISESIKGSGKSAFEPFITGFTRARESGEGFFASVLRGVRGQVNSISILRNISQSLADAFRPFATGFARARAEGLSFFAAFDRGLTGQLQSIRLFRSATESIGSGLRATGLSAFFDPLVTGFTRAREAGQGFIQATARGLSGQINSSSAYRATRDAVVSLGESFVDAAGKIIGYRASTEAGRKAFGLFRASLDAVRSTSAEAVQYLGVLQRSVSAAVNALPSGRALVEAFSAGWRSLSSATTRVASDTGLLAGIFRTVANSMTLAAVAGGAYAAELRHMGEEARTTRNLADRFGATTQEIEKLRYAAEAAGVGINQLAKGQQQLFSSISKIRVGQINTDNVREAKLAFDRLGIGIEELRNRKPQELFEDIAKKLTAIKDPADRTAIAFDLFGKQGAAILPALKSLGQVEKDVERLDVTTNSLDFSRVEAVGASFSRLQRATASYTEASMTAFTELQAGFNNFRAEFLGGLATLVQYSGSLYADTTKPLAVLLEVTGRIINIMLRAAGAVVKFASAFSIFPAVARFAQALGEKIKQLLEYLEEGVARADAFANAMYNALTPQYWTGAVEGGKTLNQQLLETIQTLALTVVSAGAAKAALELAGFQPGRAFKALAAMIRLPEISLRSLASAAIATFRALTIGITQTAINYVASAMKIIAVNSQMGIAAIIKWITPSLAGMVSYVTGIRAIEVATRIMAVRMAASWVIATAGLALIPVIAIAIYENFDKLSAFFAQFKNIGRLFTFEGAAEAARSAASAIWNAFKSILSNISGFVGSVVRKIVEQFVEIEPPPALDSAKASSAEVVFQRQKIAQAQFERQRSVEVQFSAAGFSMPPVPPPPVEDTKAMAEAIDDARSKMNRLVIESAKFGDGSAKATEQAVADFAKLQERLRIDPKFTQREFEEQAKKITGTLRKNLLYFSKDNASDALKKNREFFKSLDDLVKEGAKQAREIQAGSDIDGALFPASDEIKKRADAAVDQYSRELERIKELKQSGALGEGPQAEAAARVGTEDAQRRFKQNLDAIGRDTSFADEIRKSLETAFLSPLQEYEKQLKKIQDNKSLSPAEKAAATVAEQKKMVESTFGKTEGQSFKEKQDLLNAATTKDIYGRTAMSQARGEMEQRKLDADRRSAAGLDNSPAEQLQLGVDKINSLFGVGENGKTAADLSPKELSEYNEAIKKNRESVLQSVGVEKSAVQVREEAQRRLQGLALSAEEAAQAQRSISDSFMSALGITKTPFEQFSSQINNIAAQFKMAGQPLDKVRESLKGNAADLALFDRAVKEARDGLLASLGVEKTAQQAYEEQIAKIEEAVNAGPENGGITVDEGIKAKQVALQKRDESLGAGGAASNVAARFNEQKKAIEEAYGVGGKNDPERFNLAMRQLKQSAPGAEQQSPLDKFNESLSQLKELAKTGAISPEEFQSNKLNLQAELQESLGPALDNLKPDRRGIEGSDVRSKAGVDTFFRILRGNDNPSLKAQLEIARNTKVLAEASKTPDAAPALFQFGG